MNLITNDIVNVHSLDVMNPQECSDVVDKIYSLESCWLELGGDLFSLGYPLYQAGEITKAYGDYAEKYNNLMYCMFKQLYQMIVSLLENFLSQKVYFQHGISIPGFHIFNFLGECNFNGGCMHFDLSYKDAFKNPNNDDKNHISIILPLRLPTHPCGLDVWNFTYSEALCGLVPRDELERERLKIFVPYLLGRVNLMYGLYWHRISPITKCYTHEQRITFQAHCSRIDGRWILYW